MSKIVDIYLSWVTPQFTVKRTVRQNDLQFDLDL